MKQADIMEAFVMAFEEKIIKEWRHEGFLGGWSSEHINFELDGKEYVVRIAEVKEGGHWSDIPGTDYAEWLQREQNESDSTGRADNG